MSGLIEKLAEKMEKKVDQNLAAMEQRITEHVKRVEEKVDKLVLESGKK